MTDTPRYSLPTRFGSVLDSSRPPVASRRCVCYNQYLLTKLTKASGHKRLSSPAKLFVTAVLGE
jgi:hypothetical protein